MFSDQIFLRETVVKESTDKMGEAYTMARKKGRRGRRGGGGPGEGGREGVKRNGEE